MLRTRNVFIDTQCFVAAGLHFENAVFEQLSKLCMENEVSLLITEIVQMEVENKISESIRDSISSINNFQRKAKILSNIEDITIKNFFVDLDEKRVQQLAKREFHNFLEDCNVTTVPMQNISIDNIIKQYFNKEAPFGDGKKKNEFPDAITLEALRTYIKDTGIYVISNDNDLKSYCDTSEHFFHLDSIDKFLNIYSSHENSVSEAINNYITENWKSIEEELVRIFEEADAYNYSSWEDSELQNHKVISISEPDISIIYIEENTSLVTLHIKVEFEAEVSGPDFINGYYDSEDKVVIPMNHSRKTESEEIEFSVEMNLDFEIGNNAIRKVIYDLHINGLAKGIEFSIEEGHDDF